MKIPELVGNAEPLTQGDKLPRRLDTPPISLAPFERDVFWSTLSRTPGVGVSVTDTKGRLLFVNDTALELFEGHANVDYHGKTIADFHSREFTEERLKLIEKVVKSNKPCIFRHVILGQAIESTLWPIRDRHEPFDRVIVITRRRVGGNDTKIEAIETVDSEYIELGQLNVLTPRELEVFIMLGHGMSIPQIAKALIRSPKTLERHKTAIARKLSLKNQAEMVRIVTLLGLSYEDAFRTRLTSEKSQTTICPPDLPR
jgi:DNA-binding CsgD family transcriptional regulator